MYTHLIRTVRRRHVVVTRDQSPVVTKNAPAVDGFRTDIRQTFAHDRRIVFNEIDESSLSIFQVRENQKLINPSVSSPLVIPNSALEKDDPVRSSEATSDFVRTFAVVPVLARGIDVGERIQ